MFQGFKEISLCEGCGEVMNNSKELLDAMIQQAAMIVSYYKALMNEGMDAKDALKIAIAYQDSQIKAAAMANIEKEKNILLSSKSGSFSN